MKMGVPLHLCWVQCCLIATAVVGYVADSRNIVQCEKD